jgi:hypothetical protein
MKNGRDTGELMTSPKLNIKNGGLSSKVKQKGF